MVILLALFLLYCHVFRPYRYLTVTVTLAAPTDDCAVITAVPFVNPRNTPFVTDTHDGLLLLHVTACDMLLGKTATRKVYDALRAKLIFVIATLLLLLIVTDTTVTVVVALRRPSNVLAVIVDIPGFNPVTAPEVLTVATLGILELHTNNAFVALGGDIVGTRVTVLPFANCAGDIESPII